MTKALLIGVVGLAVAGCQVPWRITDGEEAPKLSEMRDAHADDAAQERHVHRASLPDLWTFLTAGLVRRPTARRAGV